MQGKTVIPAKAGTQINGPDPVLPGRQNKVTETTEMNEILCKAERAYLIENVEKLSKWHNSLFKQMYSPNNRDVSIKECVNNMDDKQLAWAVKLVKSTLS